MEFEFLSRKKAMIGENFSILLHMITNFQSLVIAVVSVWHNEHASLTSESSLIEATLQETISITKVMQQYTKQMQII